MTKKETIIKAISEMNINLLDVALEKEVYMDVPKELFLKQLQFEFENQNRKGISKFDTIEKGTCFSCHKDCSGYTFMNEQKEYLDLLIYEKDNCVEVSICHELVNDNHIEKDGELYISFKNDEKLSYQLSPILKSKRNTINRVLEEFRKFEANVTDVDDFITFFNEYQQFFNNINIYEKINFNFIDKFTSIFHKLENICDLKRYHSFAIKAITEFDNIKKDDESAIIDWLLKYENNNLYLNDYQVTENWQNNYLILFDNSDTDFKEMVIDASKYKGSVRFSKTYYDLYFKYTIKYEPKEEHYELYGYNGGLSLELPVFLAVNDLYPEILKKYNKKTKEEIKNGNNR